MANVNNAFAALIGAESQLASSKKKNKSKAKQNVDHNTVLQPVAAPAVVSNSHAAPMQSSVDVSEATAILERAAREARTIGDKNRLWKEWTKQVSQETATSALHDIARPPQHKSQGIDRSGKGIKYKTSDGASLDFKQVKNSRDS